MVEVVGGRTKVVNSSSIFNGYKYHVLNIVAIVTRFVIGHCSLVA